MRLYWFYLQNKSIGEGHVSIIRLFYQQYQKTLYVLEELGVDYEFKYVDLFKGEHKEDSFLKLNPLGKTPVLKHNNDSLFESGAICRYVANVAESSLYPEDKLQRAKVDQWMDFFSCHLGKWLSTLYFENIIKEKANLGSPNKDNCDEAINFANQQFSVVDKWLSENKYLAGDELTIADLFAFAYIEQVNDYNFSLDEFQNVTAWFDKLDQRESIIRGRKKLKQ
jgi:glutathione S-transferase